MPNKKSKKYATRNRVATDRVIKTRQKRNKKNRVQKQSRKNNRS